MSASITYLLLSAHSNSTIYLQLLMCWIRTNRAGYLPICSTRDEEGFEPSHSHHDLIGFEPNYLSFSLACESRLLIVIIGQSFAGLDIYGLFNFQRAWKCVCFISYSYNINIYYTMSTDFLTFF